MQAVVDVGHDDLVVVARIVRRRVVVIVVALRLEERPIDGLHRQRLRVVNLHCPGEAGAGARVQNLQPLGGHGIPVNLQGRRRSGGTASTISHRRRPMRRS